MTASFWRNARRAHLMRRELCAKARSANAGQAVHLGQGVFKIRLGHNRYRGILLARGGKNGFYVYLFAKQDQSDLDPSEREGLLTLAREYELLANDQITVALNAKKLTEVRCDESQVQESRVQGHS